MKTLLLCAGFAAALTTTSAGLSAGTPPAQYDRSSGQVRLTNGRLELLIDTKFGLSPNSLRDTKTGRVYADTDYVWSGIRTPVLTREPEIKKSRNGSITLRLIAAEGPLLIEQVFTASPREPGVIAERIRVRNTGKAQLDTSNLACGFAKEIDKGGGWLKSVADSRFCNIPYRVDSETGELCDYTLEEIATRESKYTISRTYDKRTSAAWGAEAWAWYGGGNALLISKYNNDAMEWSLMEPVPGAEGKGRLLRFGGAGRWKLGDPEGAASLAPGGSFTFGETRYQAIDGGWQEAFSEFRRYTQAKGHRLPRNFDPPVHWNELYDNHLWWGEDTAENRAKLYRRADMAAEAQKAKEIGCECLYLDPGWDTAFASNIWAEDRLGSQRDFVKWIDRDYGLKYLALHTPIAPWTDPSTYPDECRRMDQGGKRLGELCATSSVYVKIKLDRLKQVCRDGAYFLMYDGSWFAECWDSTHGHSVPLKRQEHVDTLLRLAQGLHREFPKVLIEQHDPILGPIQTRYAPTYFMHSKKGAFDELWGYEYLVDTLGDITSRRAMSLYYVNLAYWIPIYLHFDLSKDNVNALGFWWYASTCRHLGFGGKSTDPAIWESHKAAMNAYMANKPFFTRGTFYGLDETVHVHTLTSKRACAMNCFNLTDKPETREITFKLSDIGLPSGRVSVNGADCTTDGDVVTLRVAIPAMGHTLVKLRV